MLQWSAVPSCFRIVGIDFGRIQLLVARLLSDEPNSFSTVVLSVLFTSMERTSGNPVAEPFSSLTIACRS